MKMKAHYYATEHVTEFFYNQHIRENVLIVNMMPLQDENQTREKYNLEITPSAKIFHYEDQYGNTRHFFNILKNHVHLKIKSSSQVIVRDPKQCPDFLDEKEWEDLKKLNQISLFWNWLQFGYFTKMSNTLQRFLKDEAIDKHSDPLTSLKNLNTKIFSTFSYSPKSTDVNSHIEEILMTKKGVCQDYTHVMITIARFWGIPSRYVSGYLYQEKGSANYLPNESHAWCECYLPSLGWVGFDPTNNKLVDAQYIKVAVGKDYEEVPPHKGSFKGGVTDKLVARVTVKKIK